MLVLHSPCFYVLPSGPLSGPFDDPNALSDALFISRFNNAGSPVGNAAQELRPHCREFRKLYGGIPILPVSKTELPHCVERIPIHPVHILVIIGSDLELSKSV
jgi:hypothetical protein